MVVLSRRATGRVLSGAAGRYDRTADRRCVVIDEVDDEAGDRVVGAGQMGHGVTDALSRREGRLAIVVRCPRVDSTKPCSPRPFPFCTDQDVFRFMAREVSGPHRILVIYR
jgi:hypothetical protein